MTAEPIIRLTAFAGVFAIMAVWEMFAPRRPQAHGRWTRWPSNIGIVILNTVVLRTIIPTTAVAIALFAQQHGWGLFNLVALPGWIAIILTVLLLDLAIYVQHVVFHYVPALWRLHRMHHADLEFDVTTGIRFHPVEIILSMAIKLAVVIVIGAPAVAVLIFEVLINATAMFNHSNVRFGQGLDKLLRLIVVTPDMHRVHHSVLRRETDSNFGFNVPWWDRMFGTYRDQPEAGHDAMTIGIEQFRALGELRLDRILSQPFRRG